MRSSEKLKILAGHWTIQLSRQNGRLFHWPKCSCMSTKTKRWKLLLQPDVCMSSLIVQWPARVFLLFATAHDSETGLFLRIYGCQLYQISCFPSGDVSKHCS